MGKFDIWLNGLEPGRRNLRKDLVIYCARYCNYSRDSASRLITDAIRDGKLKRDEFYILRPE